MMQKIIPYILTALVCAAVCSCASARPDSLYSDETNKNNLHAAAEIEKQIVKEYAKTLSGAQPAVPDTENIKKALDTLLASPSSDSEYLSFVYALYADYYLLTGDKSLSKKMLKSAETYNAYDEYAQLVHSRHISGNKEKKDYLVKLVLQNSDAYRLKAELGFIHTLFAEYTAALAAFDASLPFLPEEYTLLYGEKRSQSQKLYTVETDLASSSTLILEKEEIVLSDMALLAQEYTSAFDFITGTAKWNIKKLNEKLREAGWYAPDTIPETQKAKRKDAALFLWHMVAGTNAAKLNRYSVKYAAKGKSPIQDVPLDTVYFDSIIGITEEDIIPLVNGKSFEPDKAVNGLDFYKWLKKADGIR